MLPPGLIKLLYGLLIATVVAAIQFSFGLGERLAKMTGYLLSDTASILAVAGLAGICCLVALQVFHLDDKLYELFLKRKLQFEWKPGEQPTAHAHPSEWCVHVRNKSQNETVNSVRAVLVSFRRAEWQHAMPVGGELLETDGRTHSAPDDILTFRLARCVYDNDIRAVLLMPGTKTENWMPKGRYIVRVKVFGQSTAPDENYYVIDFLAGEPGSTFSPYDPSTQASDATQAVHSMAYNLKKWADN